MNYRDLIDFRPIDSSVVLQDADRREDAERLMAEFLVSPDQGARLTGQIFPYLRPDQPSNGRLLLITGPRGVGKSHLLVAVTALAEDAARLPLLARQHTLAGDIVARIEGLVGPDAVAGRYRVLRMSLRPSGRPLREVVLEALAARLTEQGVPGVPSGPFRRSKTPVPGAAVLAAARTLVDGRGLLLAIDELSPFLAARPPEALPDDLDFLRELGEAGREPGFRVLAAANSLAYGGEEDTAVNEARRRLGRHCVELPLGGRDASFVLAARVLRKTPEQRAWIAAHLARFAPALDNLRERLDEYVELFPLHPDFGALFEQEVFAERRGVTRLLSDVVAQRLDDGVPEHEPGIIAYDSYWPVLRRNPRCRHVPDIAAVIDFSAQLEARIAASGAPAAEQAMARRILFALSIQRLTAGDLYNRRGPTALALRDDLCLTVRDHAVPEGSTPSLALTEAVVGVAEQLRRMVNGPRITVRVHGGRYHLYFRKFRRFHGTELVLHWVNAVPFLLLMGSGAFMLAARFSDADRELLSRTVGLHKFCALAWLIGMPLTVLSRFRPHWTNIRTLLTWGPTDAVWMIQSLRSLYRKDAVIPPAGRLNTGQKINACLVVIYFFGFAATGALMYWRGSALIPWYVHTALFFASLGSVGGHLYLALVNPSTRVALGGIFHGWAPISYVEHHHALMIPRAAREHARPPGMRALAREVLYSRVEMGVLILTVLLGAFGAHAFGAGRLALVKRQFSKSFGDLIQPSRLSTKHNIGPTAESCTKCHLYTGEIPDTKCEACHENIRERREEKIGYHGTLKGDCRYCHREHRDRSGGLVPLDRDTFDHDEAAFALAGKHAQVKCDECHKKLRREDTPGIYYLGLPHNTCTDCHEDRHRAQFKAACDTCHSPRGWTGREVNFVHDRDSTFKLEGKHADVTCRKCHEPAKASDPLGAAKFKGLDRTCLGCHQDPHRKQFADRCTGCHSPAGWDLRHLDFDHNKDAKFALKAKHAQVACDQCHRPQPAGGKLASAQFVDLKTGCADCHRDPHGAQFKKTCTTCHPGPETWKVDAPQFVHNRDTKFALEGRHRDVRCDQCHQPQPAGGKLASARFAGLGTGCADCHQVKHPASYGTACTACHATDAWSRRKGEFDHGRDAGFELVGKHLVAKCSACHTTELMGVVDRKQDVRFTCLSCHQKDDPHRGTLGIDCAKCHGTLGWKGDDLLFDHDRMTRFPLDRDHEKVACAKCHQDNHWKPVDTACSSCHTKFFLDQNKR